MSCPEIIKLELTDNLTWLRILVWNDNYELVVTSRYLPIHSDEHKLNQFHVLHACRPCRFPRADVIMTRVSWPPEFESTPPPDNIEKQRVDSNPLIKISKKCQISKVNRTLHPALWLHASFSHLKRPTHRSPCFVAVRKWEHTSGYSGKFTSPIP